MMITKSWCKVSVDFFIFSIFFSDNPLDFDDSIWVMSLKYLMYFLAGRNAKSFWNIAKEKYFAPLRILSLFTESYVNLFVDTAFVNLLL